jgi:hypothetical protein
MASPVVGETRNPKEIPISKSQIPNPNEIPKFNVQFPMGEAAVTGVRDLIGALHWKLVIEISLGFGIWKLGFRPS